jgi:hypothetical protein
MPMPMISRSLHSITRRVPMALSPMQSPRGLFFVRFRVEIFTNTALVANIRFQICKQILPSGASATGKGNNWATRKMPNLYQGWIGIGFVGTPDWTCGQRLQEVPNGDRGRCPWALKGLELSIEEGFLGLDRDMDSSTNRMMAIGGGQFYLDNEVVCKIFRQIRKELL